MDCAQAIEKMHNGDSDVQTDAHTPLSDKWVLWAHLPHNTDWSLKSYINIKEISAVEEVVALNNYISDTMITNCMLFLMRKNINPTWEDEKNVNGGSFSFKITNKEACKIWRNLMCAVTGETISDDDNFLECVNGITISPKKSFCIIKIWMSSIKYQSTTKLNKIDGLSTYGCLFKKHK
tara:strand:+ start:237 stop:773 length:537 start_codon:yes stop_codon:yes gene_type:complete